MLETLSRLPAEIAVVVVGLLLWFLPMRQACDPVSALPWLRCGGSFAR